MAPQLTAIGSTPIHNKGPQHNWQNQKGFSINTSLSNPIVRHDISYVWSSYPEHVHVVDTGMHLSPANTDLQQLLVSAWSTAKAPLLLPQKLHARYFWKKKLKIRYFWSGNFLWEGKLLCYVTRYGVSLSGFPFSHAYGSSSRLLLSHCHLTAVVVYRTDVYFNLFVASLY